MFKQKIRSRRTPVPLEDFWMGLAFWIAAKSENTEQEGAIIVTDGNLLLYGYDSSPLPDGQFFRHAERIALQNRKLDGSIMYVTRTPCADCLLEITATNLKKIVYFKTKELDDNSQEIIKKGRLNVKAYSGNLNWMRDYVMNLKDMGVFS